MKILSILMLSCISCLLGEQLFDGSSLEHWQFAENAWYIDEDGSMTCRMKEEKLKNGQVRKRGMGYAWTAEKYEDFELELSYKLSAGANSGVFFRTDKDNPVQGGFEIQLLDDDGFQKLKVFKGTFTQNVH